MSPPQAASQISTPRKIHMDHLQLENEAESLRPKSRSRQKFCLTLRQAPAMPFALDSPMKSPIGLYFDDTTSLSHSRPSTKGQSFCTTPLDPSFGQFNGFNLSDLK